MISSGTRQEQENIIILLGKFKDQITLLWYIAILLYLQILGDHLFWIIRHDFLHYIIIPFHVCFAHHHTTNCSTKKIDVLYQMTWLLFECYELICLLLLLFRTNLCKKRNVENRLILIFLKFFKKNTDFKSLDTQILRWMNFS